MTLAIAIGAFVTGVTEHSSEVKELGSSFDDTVVDGSCTGTAISPLCFIDPIQISS